MSLKTELGLRRDVQSLDHEALLNIDLTAFQLRKRADAFFKAHGLTDVQFNLLMLLRYHYSESGGLTQVELSRMMLVNRANITSLLDRAERGGLVQRTAVLGDRRCNVVKLTERGVAVLEGIEKDYRNKVKAVMGVLPQERLKELIDSLEKVRANLSAMDI